MYKVLFSPSAAELHEAVIVSHYPSVEQAIAFALELHRVSNCEHIVYVHDSDGSQVLSLVLVKPAK